MARLILPLFLLLCGCVTARDETPRRGTLTGFFTEAAQPGSIKRAQNLADDNKCREYGFTPGTETYGNCRIQLDQTRATREANGRPVRVRLD